MNTRTNNNPAYILATLGVYFGLVLVGATPVFGHAATTRVFDVKDEIERNDDLEKNPDRENTIMEFSSAFIDIYRITSDHATDISNWIKPEQYSFDCLVSTGPKKYLSKRCFGLGSSLPSIDLGKVSGPIRNLHHSFFSPEDFTEEKLRVRFDFTTDSSSLNTTLTLENLEVAVAYASTLDKALQLRRSKEIDVLKQVVVNATVVEHKDLQGLISTQLPRSAIDPLIVPHSK